MIHGTYHSRSGKILYSVVQAKRRTEMFGKKKLKAFGTAEGAPVTVKAKPQSPRDVLIDRLEHLAPGQEIGFRLPPMYGPDLIVVEAEKDYPAKGHRYAVASTDPVDGKPGPNRRYIWRSNKSKPVVAWIMIRSGEMIL
jgi:hypothetical protein